jgi:hypothetical protein
MSSVSVLPKFEFCYETIIHNKIISNHVLFIPEGEQKFLWINKNGVWIVDYINREDVEKKVLSFHPSLSNGTLFYGVYFQYENVNFYAIEDIILYKGKNIAFSTFTHKLSLFENILKKDIQQQPTNHPDDVIIGLPIITSIDKINNDVISSLPYKIKYIQFRNYKKQNGNQRFQMPYIDYLDLCIQEKNKVFLVKPDIKNDIYHLYRENKYVDVACIPDYKTSVFMNKLFRNIKENDNLDLLEESDDENDEEFVYLDREYKMLCNYNKQFKKWTPISLENSLTNGY